MTLRSAALSDIGLLRNNNEDRYLRNDELGLYGVADGIGGLPCGAEAAELTVNAVLRCVMSQSQSRPDLAACVTAANDDVMVQGRILSPINGMGTTLVFGVVRNNTLHIAHLGDSRCYLLRKGKLRQLTSDHNVETEAKARKARGEYMLVTERNRGALTRCIGQITHSEPDIFSEPLLPGDTCLFCSDGLYRMIEDKELAEALARTVGLEIILKDLIMLANERGGHDNSTGVLLRVE